MPTRTEGEVLTEEIRAAEETGKSSFKHGRGRMSANLDALRADEEGRMEAVNSSESNPLSFFSRIPWWVWLLVAGAAVAMWWLYSQRTGNSGGAGDVQGASGPGSDQGKMHTNPLTPSTPVFSNPLSIIKKLTPPPSDGGEDNGPAGGSGSNGTGMYTVQPGDTLRSISDSQYGSPDYASTIRYANDTKHPSLRTNPHRLMAGWVLDIPTHPSTPS